MRVMLISRNRGLIAGGNGGPPVSQATRDAVTDLYAAYARRDFERVAALIDEVDEASVDRAGVGEQTDYGLEDFVQIQ